MPPKPADNAPRLVGEEGPSPSRLPAVEVEAVRAAIQAASATGGGGSGRLHEWVSTIVALAAVLAAVFGAFFTLREEVGQLRTQVQTVEQRRVDDLATHEQRRANDKATQAREITRVEEKITDIRQANSRLADKIDRVNANTIRICQKLGVPCD